MKPGCPTCGHIPDLPRGAIAKLRGEGLDVSDFIVAKFVRGDSITLDAVDKIAEFLDATSSVAKQ